MKNENIDGLSSKKYNDISGLNRVRMLQKTAIMKVQKPVSSLAIVRKAGRNMDIARSKVVSHFAPRQTTDYPLATVKPRPVANIATSPQSFVAKTDTLHHAPQQPNDTKPPVTASGSDTAKQQAIADAFQKLEAHKENEAKKSKLNQKIVNVIAIIIGIILLLAVGYYIYVSMPSLSVKVASAQAGINATFPEYHPDGYSLSGPVSYSDGEVTITFHSNTSNSKFVINQSRSSWDSSALKDKVNQDSKGEFLTTTQNGLTIYTYNSGNASWVNGGILYTITGNASLSCDQITRIATSL